MTNHPAEDVLMHYGVKGMRWGKSSSGVTTGGKRKKAHPVMDTVFGTESGYKKTKTEKAKSKKNSAPSKSSLKTKFKNLDKNQKAAVIQLAIGAAFLTPGLANGAMNVAGAGKFIGYSAMNKATQAKGRKAAQNMFAQNMGITNYQTVKVAYDAASKTWK